MKAIVLEPFEYYGRGIEIGIIECSDAELQSMSFFGRIRPATSTEIEEAGLLDKPEKRKPERAQSRQYGKENAAR